MIPTFDTNIIKFVGYGFYLQLKLIVGFYFTKMGVDFQNRVSGMATSAGLATDILAFSKYPLFRVLGICPTKTRFNIWYDCHTFSII